MLLDFRGDLFNAFNHGQLGVASTTLTSGIPTDAYTGDNGTNTFANYPIGVSGHRNAQFFVKIRF